MSDPAQPGILVGDWDRDLTDTSTITAGQVVAKNGALFQAKVTRTKGTQPNWQKHKDDVLGNNTNNEDFLRLTYPYSPRNFASMIHGVRGTGGRGTRKSRYQRPIGTARRQVVLTLTTSSPSQYRFDWDTDVRVNLPTDSSYPGDLNILDARSVTCIGGRLTATGASAASGGFFRCGNIRDFIYIEGVHCDLQGRVKSVADGGGPDQHDALNLSGKTRAGSTSGHVVGDGGKYQHTEVIGGVSTTVPNLDHTGADINVKWNDDVDYTRHSHPDIYLISCRVDGVQGQESGGVHGDVLQYQGSVGSVYIDMFTGTTQYQGFQQAPTQGVTGVYCLSRTNLRAYAAPGDPTPDSAFLYWFTNGTVDRELPPVFLDEVYAGPGYNSDGTPMPLFDLVHPNEDDYLTSGTREGMQTGFRDMGYAVQPGYGMNCTATSNVFTTIRFNTDGTTTTTTPHGLANGAQVVFTRGTDSTKTGAPFGGITWETVAYYVVNATSTTFQIASVEGGSPLTVTDFTGGVFATPTYVVPRRTYVAPSFAMPYSGVIVEGLPGDPDWTTTAQCGLGYTPQGSQWDSASTTSTAVTPIVTWDGATGTQPARPAVPTGQVVIWAQPTNPFIAGVALTGDVWINNSIP